MVKILRILKREYGNWRKPIVTKVQEETRNPFKILISTVLSLRTKDAVTEKASNKLFDAADTPDEILKLSEKRISKLIYPVAFYRVKARNIKRICKIILNEYKGKVPETLHELLKLPGVGRKTANLVITLGYNKLGICVDTHVHRISNRLRYVNTKTPFETEMALREKLPERWWIDYNNLLVSFGQNICRPVKPLCAKCPIRKYCNFRPEALMHKEK